MTDLGKRFPTEDKGALVWILNVAISRDRAQRTLSLSQELYVHDLVTKYGAFMDASTTRKFDSPLDEHCDLAPEHSPTVGSPEYIELTEQRQIYMSVVGGLLWLANMSRPDIAYAASQLSRLASSSVPSKQSF